MQFTRKILLCTSSNDAGFLFLYQHKHNWSVRRTCMQLFIIFFILIKNYSYKFCLWTVLLGPAQYKELVGSTKKKKAHEFWPNCSPSEGLVFFPVAGREQGHWERRRNASLGFSEPWARRGTRPWRALWLVPHRSPISGRRSSSTSSSSPPSLLLCPRTSPMPSASSITVRVMDVFFGLCLWIAFESRFWICGSGIGWCAAGGVKAVVPELRPGVGKVGAGRADGDCAVCVGSDPAPGCLFWRTGLFLMILLCHES